MGGCIKNFVLWIIFFVLVCPAFSPIFSMIFSSFTDFSVEQICRALLKYLFRPISLYLNGVCWEVA